MSEEEKATEAKAQQDDEAKEAGEDGQGNDVEIGEEKEDIAEGGEGGGGENNVEAEDAISAFEVRTAKLFEYIVESYEGETANGLFHGKGKVVFTDGNVYEGDFQNGLMDGEGTFTWGDGTVYTGSVSRNALSGTGSYRWPDGSTYSGGVLDGLKHGNGQFRCGAVPAIYDGEWKDGKRHGEGTLYYDSDKSQFYRGSWKEDCRHGKGYMVYRSGNVYEGDWADDMRHGRGKMEWHDKRQVYEGEWERGLYHGTGEFIWFEDRATFGATQRQMCNRYKGQWMDGRKAGEGVFFYADGGRYEGEWMNDEKHGKGVYTKSNGKILKGIFENDKLKRTTNSPAKGAQVQQQQQKEEEQATSTKDSSPKKRRVMQHVVKDPGSGVVLHIEDIVKETGLPPKELLRVRREIEKMVIRWNSALKLVYSSYALTDSSKAELFTMSRLDLLRLCRDAKIMSEKFTAAHLNRTLENVRAEQLLQETETGEDDDTEDVHAFSPNLHDMSGSVLYREYVEVLVRISNRVLRDLPNLSTPSKRMMHLMHGNFKANLLVDRNEMESGNKEAFEVVPKEAPNEIPEGLSLSAKQLSNPELLAVFEKHRGTLRAVYDRFAEEAGGEEGSGDVTLRGFGFSKLLKECGALEKLGGPRVAYPLFSGCAFYPINSARGLQQMLNVEVIFEPEFFERIAQIAVSLSEREKADTVSKVSPVEASAGVEDGSDKATEEESATVAGDAEGNEAKGVAVATDVEEAKDDADETSLSTEDAKEEGGVCVSVVEEMSGNDPAVVTERFVVDVLSAIA